MTIGDNELRILSPWFNVVRRLRSMASTGSYAIIAIQILVDDRGQPIRWTTPTSTRLEPRVCDSIPVDLVAPERNNLVGPSGSDGPTNA